MRIVQGKVEKQRGVAKSCRVVLNQGDGSLGQTEQPEPEAE